MKTCIWSTLWYNALRRNWFRLGASRKKYCSLSTIKTSEKDEWGFL